MNYITEVRGNYFRLLQQRENNGNAAQHTAPSTTAPAADTGDDLPF